MASEVDGLHLRVGPNLAGRTRCDLRALGHHSHPVGDAKSHVHVVLDEHHGDGAGKRLEDVGKPNPVTWGQAGGWLIEEQQCRRRRDGHADIELALPTVGEASDNRCEIIGQPDEIGSVAGRERRDRDVERRFVTGKATNADRYGQHQAEHAGGRSSV
jgi:hypothetical protein